jgi:polar amino acid transport system substrate-binding protein
MRAMMRRLLPPAAVLVATLAAVAACGDGDDATDPGTTAATGAADRATDAATDDAADAATDGATGAAGQCSPDSLETLEPGTLTVATGDPAFEPWVVGDAPESGEGFEAAVAYAVAGQLGYAEDQVTWVRTPFEAAIQPGPKTFDVNLQQFSITDEREEAVDFSSPYYEARQAVVAIEGSPAAEATGLADLAGVSIGAASATTSLLAAEEFVPDAGIQVFNNNDDLKLALINGQVDAGVFDLPTALFITAVELEGGVVVGQFPVVEGETDAFGLLLENDSPLTDCVTQAVDALREDGTLADLEAEWLTDVAGAPELS